jgi:hypothetical protein
VGSSPIASTFRIGGRNLVLGRAGSQASRGLLPGSLRCEYLAPSLAWSAFALLLAIAASRSPYLLLNGRFWAEEGTEHFRRAVVGDSADALLHVHAGYFNLHANASTWFASLAELRFAPLVTVWLSFAVVAAILWVVLWWPSRLLLNGASRLAAAGLLVVGPIAFPEVWLNSLNAQTYLGVLTLLIAFVPTSVVNNRRFVVGAAMLGIAGLSGLYSAAFAPLFWFEAWRERTRRAISYAVIISAAGLVQLAIVLVAQGNDTTGSPRFSTPSLEDLWRSIVGRQLSTLVVGHEGAEELLRGSLRSGRGLVMTALAIALVVLLFAFGRYSRDRTVLLQLGVAFVLVQLLVQLGALGDIVGGRYTVVPLAILTLMVVHAAASPMTRWLRWTAALLCAAILVAGVSGFWTYRKHLVQCSDCPRWSEEVESYEAGESTELEIWPYQEPDAWILELPLVRGG